jgi:hypothetical protein
LRRQRGRGASTRRCRRVRRACSYRDRRRQRCSRDCSHRCCLQRPTPPGRLSSLDSSRPRARRRFQRRRSSRSNRWLHLNFWNRSQGRIHCRSSLKSRRWCGRSGRLRGALRRRTDSRHPMELRPELARHFRAHRRMPRPTWRQQTRSRFLRNVRVRLPSSRHPPSRFNLSHEGGCRAPAGAWNRSAFVSRVHSDRSCPRVALKHC